MLQNAVTALCYFMDSFFISISIKTSETEICGGRFIFSAGVHVSLRDHGSVL